MTQNHYLWTVVLRIVPDSFHATFYVTLSCGNFAFLLTKSEECNALIEALKSVCKLLEDQEAA